MIEMKYISEPIPDVQPYGIEATYRVSDEATADEMVETFVEVMKVTSMSDYNIAHALKQVYYNFIYEKDLQDAEIKIEQ